MLSSWPSKNYDELRSISIEKGANLFYGFFEERSSIPAEWITSTFARVVEICETDNISEFYVAGDSDVVIKGSSKADIHRLLDGCDNDPLYIDITGLSHHVWMPLLRGAIELKLDVRCIYSEPEKYQFTSSPRPGEFFDLSTRIRGISPVPSFTKLGSGRELKTIIVPLLGFEGTRFRYMIETLQPEGRDIYPIIGVPGFKPEYPFHTFEGNAATLEITRSWENVIFADASCPFAVTSRLAALKAQMNDVFIQIPMIGTKPHALGAVLHALRNKDVELVYDHPVRKPNRTLGAARCHVYRVGQYFYSTGGP